MSKEVTMDKRNSSLNRVNLGICLMFSLYWIYLIFISKNLPFETNIKSNIGIAVLYILGLALFLLTTKDLSKSKTQAKTISLQFFVRSFLLQFTSLLIMMVFSSIIYTLFNISVEDQTESLSPTFLFHILILFPIVEELVFRKFIGDILLEYGESLYILTSAILFTIIHFPIQGPVTLIYTFLLGLIWAYVYTKTRNIIWPILLHSISNIFGAIIIIYLKNNNIKLLSFYFFYVVILALIGLILLITNKNKVITDGKNKLIDKKAIVDLLKSWSLWLFIFLSFVAYYLIKLQILNKKA